MLIDFHIIHLINSSFVSLSITYCLKLIVSHKSLSQNTHTQTWRPFMKTPKSDLTHDSPKVVAVDNTP